MRPTLLLLAAALLAPAQLARAEGEGSEPLRVAVLPILIAGGEVATVPRVFEAIHGATALRPKLSVMSLDDYYFYDGADLATRTLACGQDPACMAEQLARFRTELGLVVIVNLELSPALVSLLLVDASTQRVVAERYGEIQPRAEELSRWVAEETRQIFDRLGHTQVGRVVVQVEPPAAKLRLDGERAPDRGTFDVFTVPPGAYRLEGSHPDYHEASTQVEVRRGEITSAQLALEPRTSILDSPWFWGGAAAVVVGAVAASVVVLGSRDVRCICFTLPGDSSCNLCP